MGNAFFVLRFVKLLAELRRLLPIIIYSSNRPLLEYIIDEEQPQRMSVFLTGEKNLLNPLRNSWDFRLILEDMSSLQG
jgi:hypothetical protein